MLALLCAYVLLLCHAQPEGWFRTHKVHSSSPPASRMLSTRELLFGCQDRFMLLARGAAHLDRACGRARENVVRDILCGMRRHCLAGLPAPGSGESLRLGAGCSDLWRAPDRCFHSATARPISLLVCC